jgi:hypothetical protein
MPKNTNAPAQRLSISLDGFYEHMDLERCLRFITRQMGKVGLETGALPAYQQSIYRDLRSPLDEETLASLHEYWTYDTERLIKRGRGWRQGVPAKPRIDVCVELTSKGNFKAEWFPSGMDRWGNVGPDGADFTYFHRSEHRHVAFDSRPSNELFFIHDVQKALYHLNDGDEQSTHLFAHVLLAACAQVVRSLKERLEPHFEVTMQSDVFVEWVEDENSSIWDNRARLARWAIDDPERRKFEAELEELANMQAQLGFPESAFAASFEMQSFGKKGATGPAPAPHTLHDRIARDLKRQGFAATPKKVERAVYLIEKHRKPSNVVPLRPRESRSD